MPNRSSVPAKAAVNVAWIEPRSLLIAGQNERRDDMASGIQYDLGASAIARKNREGSLT
jgi:hypothetical protein